MERRREASRGFTLIEVLTGLLVLGFVMTTSLAVFYERETRLQHAEELVLVWQAISNEAELIRYEPWHSLGASGTTAFRSDLEILDPLEDVTTAVEVSDVESSVKAITLRVSWGDGREASSEVIRTDTGGTNLW
ncbi:MAG: prepilin-type N-terminal cleavage/methylation domain-containing protein [Thermoanaerobaculia bacterium]|nr:prepilin-type N-terminal cleavage/methylation domain-containing protein [Thermoanaerobaculia bacterium]